MQETGGVASHSPISHCPSSKAAGALWGTVPLRPFLRGVQPAQAVLRHKPSAPLCTHPDVPTSPLPLWLSGVERPGGCRGKDPVNDPSSFSLHLLSFLSFHWEEGASFPLPPLFIFLTTDSSTDTSSLLFAEASQLSRKDQRALFSKWERAGWQDLVPGRSRSLGTSSPVFTKPDFQYC